MYETYWGLCDSPFRNTLDDRWFYESPVHAEALARMCYLVEQRRRCGLLVGAEGTGKSLLLSVLVRQLERTPRQVAAVDLLGLGGDEFLWHLASALHLSPADGDTPSRTWRVLQDHLRGLQQGRQQTVLIFDHLDRARSDCVRIIERLLCLDKGPECWTSVLIASRTMRLPAASATLAEQADLRIELSPLDPLHTGRYVHESLRRAGCPRPVFDRPALDGLYERTQGVPRNINRLCDLSLLAAMGEERQSVGREVVETAAEELQVPAPSRYEASPVHRFA